VFVPNQQDSKFQSKLAFLQYMSQEKLDGMAAQFKENNLVNYITWHRI
jgi:hypothetical protein